MIDLPMRTVVGCVLAVLLSQSDLVAGKPPTKDAPSPAEIIAAVLQMEAIPLAKGETCGNPQTIAMHPTIGRFLAQQLAVLAEGSKKREQGITAKCEPDEEHRAQWRCQVSVFMHTIPRSENILGSWGIMFLMNEHKAPVPTWFTCIGSG
jgi:hypothetical protein